MPRFVLTPMASRDRVVRRFLIALTVLGFLSLIGAAIAAAWVTGKNQQHTFWVNHTYQVEQAISDFRVASERAETARRGYLIDAQPSFRAAYLTSASELPSTLDRLAALISDNQHEVARVARLKELTARLQVLRGRTIAQVDTNSMGEAIRTFRSDGGVRLMHDVRAITSAMVSEERGLLAQRDASQHRNFRTFEIVLGIAGLLVVLVALIVLITVQRYTRDLTATTTSLRELNDTLEDAVAERTADLTRANEEIQRFAYIVSHDLRSPLVNVMGFTAELDASAKVIEALIARVEAEAPELASEDARLAAHEDLPEAIGFIRSSTEKMDALINAILKLSRQGRRVISPERLDMNALIEKIRDTLQHRLDERGAALIVTHPLPQIVSDRLAIDQIFSNLIENAVKYLKPGRPGRIEVRGKVERNRVIYEIEDNGRGIDPRDHQRVFDLFRRSGSTGSAGRGDRAGARSRARLSSRRCQSTCHRNLATVPRSAYRFPDDLHSQPQDDKK